MHTKVLFLGNEFISVDSLACKVAKYLAQKLPHITFVHIKDSYELIDQLQGKEPLVILDVVRRLQATQLIGVQDLVSGSIISAHDFDASFFLQLLGEGKEVKIIGIPARGKVQSIAKDVEELMKAK